MSLEQKDSTTPTLQEIFIKNGLHIGSRIKVVDMEKFIYALRPDGIYLIDINKTIERLNIAAKFISLFPSDKVIITTSHVYGVKPVEKFCEIVGTIPVVKKFQAGLLTNRNLSSFSEPKLVLVTDPRYDSQAIEEASIAGIPVIAFCSTDNIAKNVDLIVPINNRGRNSLGYAFWYLAKKVLEEKGALQADKEPDFKPEDFITPQQS